MTWLEPITLSSPRVRLELLDHRHETDLIEAVKDGELWRLWYTSVPAPEKMGPTSIGGSACTQRGRCCPSP